MFGATGTAAEICIVEVKFNSKTFLFSSLWPKNASKCLKIDFFGKLVNLGQTLTCRDSMGLQLIGLRDPSHLIIYQYVPHMSYAAIRKFLRGYHNHRMCNSAKGEKASKFKSDGSFHSHATKEVISVSIFADGQGSEEEEEEEM